MVDKIRKLVSGDKYRFQEDGYDLDLTYITENVIAMGIPGDSFEKIWRNDSSEVSKFLNERHGENYMIYNLSGEKYNYKKFHYRVKEFGFPDHHPPSLRLLLQIVEDMFSWISSNPSHVAVVHCLAGRSRTGTIIACYLLYTGICKTAAEAIRFFNSQRSSTENGIVLPSQIRYVHYFERIINKSAFTALINSPKRISIKEIIITPVLLVEGGGKRSTTGGACTAVVRVEELAPPRKLIKQTRHPSAWREDNQMTLFIDCDVEGDIQIRVFHFSKDPAAFAKSVKKVFKNSLDTVKVTPKYPLIPLFRFTFHTSFIKSSTLVLGPEELDSPWAGPFTKYSFVPPHLRFEIHFGAPGEYSPSSPASSLVIDETELGNHPSENFYESQPSSEVSTTTPTPTPKPQISEALTVPTTPTTNITASPSVLQTTQPSSKIPTTPTTVSPTIVSMTPVTAIPTGTVVHPSTVPTETNLIESSILRQHYEHHQKALNLVQQQLNQQVPAPQASKVEISAVQQLSQPVTPFPSLPTAIQLPISPSNNINNNNSVFSATTPIQNNFISASSDANPHLSLSSSTISNNGQYSPHPLPFTEPMNQISYNNISNLNVQQSHPLVQGTFEVSNNVPTVPMPTFQQSVNSNEFPFIFSSFSPFDVRK